MNPKRKPDWGYSNQELQQASFLLASLWEELNFDCSPFQLESIHSISIY